MPIRYQGLTMRFSSSFCRYIQQAACGALFLLFLTSSAQTQTLQLYQEDFENVPLRPPVDENFSFPNAFSHDPPPGWQVDRSDVPGRGSPSVGVFEWEGWSFANRPFWVEANQGRRNEFTFGRDVVAVADPDGWNDLGDPANTIGLYETLLASPLIPVPTIPEQKVTLVFDSSWLGGCCDDGPPNDPESNNQTAIIKMRVNSGPAIEVLRWESAPFLTASGDPSTNPADFTNFAFKPNKTNERVFVDVTDFLPPFGSGQFSSEQDALIASALSASTNSASTHSASGSQMPHVSFEFGMEEAGDDGWWAVDNISLVSLQSTLGDMNIDGTIDALDIDAFALGMLDTTAYRNLYSGELPGTRGSLDSHFNFDDIDWFLGVLEANNVAATQETVLAAIRRLSVNVPEPSSLLLVGCAMLFWGTKRERNAQSFGEE